MTAAILSRASWGAKYGDGDITLSNKADELFIHHAAAHFESLSANEEIKYMQMLERTGYQRFGVGISYNVVVFPSGRAYRGVSWNRRGTHTGGRNSTARSICFAGNFEEQKPTEAALRTAGQIIADISGSALKSGFALRKHRDVKATACPGKNLAALVPSLLTTYAPDGHSAHVKPSKPASAPSEPVSKPQVDPAKALDVDGSRGPATISRWQWVMGTPVDGVISRPRSTVIEADQHFLNKKVSAAKIRELTGKSRLDEDAIEGPKTIRVRQWYLFNMYPQSFEKIIGRPHTTKDIDGSAGPITTRIHQHALNEAKKGQGGY